MGRNVYESAYKFILKFVVYIHSGEKHAGDDHACRTNHISNRLKNVAYDFRKTDSGEEKHSTDINGDHVNIQNNFLPLKGSFSAENFFAMCPQENKLDTHENTAIENPFRTKDESNGRYNEV